ncbi:hypothetical protein [Alteribacillus sp. YIM 98480]|uniref:hypothetical protein n=1 Tax=Alteribacillus sp. YIM 98480 TaxID=2606599 RepID=UPI00131BA8A2|nr:hypothetical protein [Alteribacillus sp. YIM 98480]
MSVKELIFIIILPSTAAIITMFVTLAMQWMLEKEVNHKQPFFLFHIVNIIFIVMMCATSSIVFHGLILKGLEIKGWLITFLYAYVYPLPLIILLYVLTVPFFRSYMQPYRIKRDTNIVHLKKQR